MYWCKIEIRAIKFKNKSNSKQKRKNTGAQKTEWFEIKRECKHSSENENIWEI